MKRRAFLGGLGAVVTAPVWAGQPHPGRLLTPVARGGGSNLILHSENLTHASWGKVRSTVSGDVIAAPDSQTTADKLVTDATAASTHYVQAQVTASSLEDNTIYTFSVHAKKSEFDWIFFQAIQKDGTGEDIYFDIVNGAVGNIGGTVVDSGIINEGGGWFRPWFCFDVLSGGTTPLLYRIYLAEANGDISINGDSSSGTYIWGVQLNKGEEPDPYTATTTAQIL